MTKLFGCLEGGGTKFVCAVASTPDRIVDEARFATTTPAETLGRALEFFKKYDLSAIGLAMFGPLDLDRSSPTYGHLTVTPKPGWASVDILGHFQSGLGIPASIDTDVNAAVLGEWTWVPANRSLDSLVYFTIGTGIGGGIVIDGHPLHGLTHPEVGHMRLPRDRKIDPFPGVCPFHGDCLEGIASGTAMKRHWRMSAESLPEGHPAWELEATYIAHALVNVILTISPRRIVLGGGVMQHTSLFPMIRSRVRKLLNSYIVSPIFSGDLNEYIVPPVLGKHSGVLGALALAHAAARKG